MMSQNELKTFLRKWENSRGRTLCIHQLEEGDVGCVVWDAALVLSSYIATHSFAMHLTRTLQKQTARNDGNVVKILELGSGTGIVGIQAATLHNRYVVTITDLPELVALMEKNVRENNWQCLGKIDVQSLCWGDVDAKIKFATQDVILIADCIYYKESLRPLVDTLLDLSAQHTLILCCYEARTEGKNPETEKDFIQMIENHFHLEEIPLEEQDLDYRSEDIHILKFTRKTIISSTPDWLSSDDHPTQSLTA